MKKIFVFIVCLFIIPCVTMADVIIKDSAGNEYISETDFKNRYNLKNGTIILQKDLVDFEIKPYNCFSKTATGSQTVTINIDLNGHDIDTLTLHALDSHPTQGIVDYAGNDYNINYVINNNGKPTKAINRLYLTNVWGEKTSINQTGAFNSNVSEKVNVSLNNVSLNYISTNNSYRFEGLKHTLRLENCKMEVGNRLDPAKAKIIDNNSWGGDINIISGSYKGGIIRNGYGTIDIKDGTFEGDIFNNSDLINVNGGNFTAGIGDENDYIFNNESKLNILGGTFTSKEDKLFLNRNSAIVNVSGGTTNNFQSQLFINDSGTVNITGVNLKTTTENSAFSSISGTLNVYGGTIEAKEASSVGFKSMFFGEDGSSPTSDKPKLYLNNGALYPIEPGILIYNSGIMYLGSKLNDNIEVEVPDGYKIQYERYKDGSYKASLVAENTPDPKEYVLGDWNDDSKFNGTDIALYRKYFANAEEEVTIDGEAKTYEGFTPAHQDFLDVNDDKTLNLADLVGVRLLAAQLNIN